MSSLLPEFEYDIFISYRHNDNRSGWVTDFVTALEEELASTIKEPLSVYFDKNPHDGLLETHDVDKSLERKLKCLVFIPIISQTYCDPKSFAWQHEFCAFNKLAREDKFGRDIRLSGGNVASRILVVKIHDLDAQDQATIENEIGGKLRSIEFIYRSAGINRPLQAKDDAVRTAGKILYQDQVNKVANAVKEIISALRNPAITAAAPSDNPAKRTAKLGNTKLALMAGVALFLVAMSYFLFFKLDAAVSEPTERSVAVLAFADMSPAKDQEWFSDGLSEEILNSLANLRELKVTARTSSFYFKDKDVPLDEIAQKLDVAYIVEGSVRKSDQLLRITAQLIRAKDGFHIWSQTYDRLADDVFKVQTDIAENIAKSLLDELTPERENRLAMPRSHNMEAYEYYLKASKLHFEKYYISMRPEYFKESEAYFLKSISLDPDYAEAYGALADLYDTRSNDPASRTRYQVLRDSVIKIAVRLDPNSVQALAVSGWSFLKREHPNLDSAYYSFRRAYQLSPNAPFVVDGISGFYSWVGLTELAREQIFRSVERDPLSITSRRFLADASMELGLYEDAQDQFQKVLVLDPENPRAHFYLGVIAAMQRNRTQLMSHLSAFDQTQTSPFAPRYSKELRALLFAMDGKRDEALALTRPSMTLLSMLKMKDEFLYRIDSLSNLSINRLNPSALTRDAQYDFVRNDPQFVNVFNKVKAKHDLLMGKYGEIE